MEKDTQVWQRRAALLFCIGVCLLLLLPMLRFLFPVLFPFAIAWGAAHAVLPLSRRLSEAVGIPARICALLLFLLLLLCLTGGAVFLVWRLVFEAKELVADFLSQTGGGFDPLAAPAEWLGGVLSRLGIQMPSGQEPHAWLHRLMGEVISSLGAWLPELAGRLFSAIPAFLFSFFVTVVAGFYFCMDPETPVRYLPRGWRQWIGERSPRVRALLGRFWRAYLLLWLLTLSELWVGLMVLGVKRALLLALIVSLVDILPVLGVGTVLVPWSVFAFLSGDIRLGLGLLVLYLIISVIRQVMEPRLVGKSLGMPPLLTLFAGYAGWHWFGVVGVILAPFGVLLLRVPVTLIYKAIKEKKE